MKPTLVAVSHGTSDAQGRQVVTRLVDAVRERLTQVEVLQAFVDVEQPDLRSVLAGIDGPATVVPLLLGAGFHVHVDIADAVDECGGAVTSTAGTLGPDAALTAILLERIEADGFGEGDAIVLAVAGSSDIRARLAADRAASALAARVGHRVRVGHLAGAGRPVEAVIAETRAAVAGRVFAANYLLAPGHFDTVLRQCSADVITPPLAHGVAVDPRLTELVVRRYDEASRRIRAELG